jgi:DNA-binding GntR family transcriptional regulator
MLASKSGSSMSKDRSVLSPLNRTPLLDSAIEEIRQAVLNGKIESGSRLNEIVYTTQLGISRTTLREAMRQLEQEGLLIRVPFRGTFVRQFSESEIKELNNLRGVLEVYAAEIIIRTNKNQPANLAALYEISRKMEKIDAEQEPTRANELHITFHRTLLNLASNNLLFSVWNNLAQQFWMAMRVAHLSHIARGDAATFSEAHREVVDAIAAGDPEKVCRVIRKHVSNSI